MTVEILRLSGLRGNDADRSASALLADHRSHPDLSRLLVIDDTAALIGHSAVYERLLTSRRLDHLLCVAVGPRAGDSGGFRFPGNISGAQGSAVLWVSDPNGIDWRLAASAIAVGHSGNSASGLHHLVELLSVDEVFDRVCEIAKHVPGGVASPGLRLAGADDEAASFAAALSTAIRRLTGQDSAPAPIGHAPFAALVDVRPGTASLAGGGELPQRHEDVITAANKAWVTLAQLADIGGLLGLSHPDVQAHVIEAGAALGTFRDRVTRLLKDGHAPGGLTEKQRGQLKAAGVRLPDPPAMAADDATGGGETGAGSKQSAVYEAVAKAVRDGDTLPQVTSRLNLTAKALGRGGSASHLPQVDQLCPIALLHLLAEPPSPPPRPWWWLAGVVGAVLGALVGGLNLAAGVAVGVLTLVIGMAVAAWSWRARVSTWRRQLALDDAVHSADGLAGLVTTVAASEWSGGLATLDEVSRARFALDGVTRQLTEHAGTADDPGSGVRASRAARLSESLSPGLRDLVLEAFAAGSTTGTVSGQEAFEQARAKTAELITDWTECAREHGALAPPPFATFTAKEVPYADGGEIAGITEAIRHDPREVMWQLCTPTDIKTLDVSGAPQVVAFAPRLIRQPLADVLPRDTVWTSSGAHAGVLRLVPLRAGFASPNWTTGEQGPEPPR